MNAIISHLITRTGAVAIMFLAAAPGISAAQEAGIALIHANVVDAVRAEPVLDATLVLRDGTIEALGVGEAPPSGARVIDVRGLWVVPGLVDAHSHVNTLSGVRRALESGVTTIRTAGASGYRDVAIRDLVRDGVIAGPDILATGVYVTPDLGDDILTDPRLVRLESGVQDVESLRHLVAVNADRGVDWIKTRGTERAGRPETDPREQVYTEEELRAVVEAAGTRGIHVLSHAHGDSGVRAAVLAGVRSVEHGTFASDETLKLMAERGTYLVPTLSSISSFGQAGDYADPRLFLRGQFMAPRRLAAVSRAYAMGIPIVAGVDTSYGPEAYARVSREVGLLVQAGLTPRDALAAATSRAAEMFELSDRFGRIAPGLEADLLVVDRNPLEDPGALQDVLLVVSNGRVVLDRLGVLSLTR
jgi:imidazolonepropionase-like amidohydrolase